MRVITAPKRDLQRARDDAIGRKRSLPGQQARILDALYRRADVLRTQLKPDVSACEPECSFAIVSHGGPACSVRAMRAVVTADHRNAVRLDQSVL